MSMAAKQARGKKANDMIFATNSQAQEAVRQYGKENVLNGTVGSILDENGDIVFLKVVEDEFRNLPRNEYVAYAPIEGLKEFVEACKQECFGQSRPDAYIEGIATAGGTGGIHHLVHNYTELGDTVITADWYWGAYKQICNDNGRELATYSLFNENYEFNFQSLESLVLDIASKQENVLIIFNTPGNNPTGFSLCDSDWDKVLDLANRLVTTGNNKVIIGVDAAYIDFSGPKEDVRRFFKKFEHLSKNILTVVCYSISKGFTMYGQRVGCMLGITSDKEVAQEFFDINQMASRGTWSNINRPAMRTVANIVHDPEKLKCYEEERNCYSRLVEERAGILECEGKEIGLPMLPYMGGFFATIPCDNPKALVEELKKENIFLIPVSGGVRIAVCSIPKRQITGLAQRIYDAMKRVGQL